MALCVKEAGKSLSASVAEVREAVDFLRYYALQARSFRRAGEAARADRRVEQLTLHGRGVFVCISPWNFPLAIFMGQVAAALVAGNSVIAKPAEQTTADRLSRGEAAARGRRAGGRAAAAARRRRGGRRGADAAIRASPAWPSPARPRPRGASTARWPRAMRPMATADRRDRRPERDDRGLVGAAGAGGEGRACIGAFDSAGQRCSALRVLFVQDDIADKVMRHAGRRDGRAGDRRSRPALRPTSAR